VALLETAGLEVRDVESLREHYVRTVRAWLATLEARWSDAVDLIGEESARVWRLYLVGGAMAFRDGRMGVDQILMVRRTAEGWSGMPPVRGGRAEGAWR
jgi:cyclopropane-fatty-acyl-phospholipid synthase